MLPPKPWQLYETVSCRTGEGENWSLAVTALSAEGLSQSSTNRTHPMKNLILAITVIAGGLYAANAAQAANVPCEELLKQLRAAEATAKPSDADKAKISDLESKGIERCNADDDKRADEFFNQALKILGK
ncbi:hypothetical protein [Rhizobium sp. NPDC090279]|uniref:hypothetical protein n=1 Tax=Rhizobium sp. NPDC090279 TaxID=3364499 RepID=UPI00383ABA30